MSLLQFGHFVVESDSFKSCNPLLVRVLEFLANNSLGVAYQVVDIVGALSSILGDYDLLPALGFGPALVAVGASLRSRSFLRRNWLFVGLLTASVVVVVLFSACLFLKIIFVVVGAAHFAVIVTVDRVEVVGSIVIAVITLHLLFVALDL